MYGPPHSLPSSASRMATCKDASHARAACWRISLAVRRIFSSHTRAGRSVPRPCRRRVCIAPVFPPRACRLLAPWGPYDPVVLEFLVALPLPVLAHLPPPNQRRSGVAARGREKACRKWLMMCSTFTYANGFTVLVVQLAVVREIDVLWQ